ncbi:Ig-like domain-containing protein [Nocardioides sp.]|uniref:Ig-like domain-containing protein n=1 Tax=Nocardioides sp. TaxID=35761 RepID=UPI0026169AAC|nr:Ig-like domain-containing protein [Nocardioides sp.]MCW2736436.1 hypothetical protein [Nocardioides sp.]
MRRWIVAAAATLLIITGTTSSARGAALAGSSTTAVSLSTTASAYGQVVTATAAVSTVPGPPQGDVVFSVDGLATKANLGASGTATVVLPAAMVGEHAVSATFVPQFPEVQQGSTSSTQSWTVARVRTRLQVRVIGKGARIPTSVQVKGAGEYGSLPTGRVTLEVDRARSADSARTGLRLNSAGVALVDLGRLHKGRYRLVVTYAGDTQHLPERRVTRFRVQQR